MNLKLITIDGPSASGKSSVSRFLAKKMGWRWVSTGAFYRGLGYAVQAANLDKQDFEAITKLVSDSIWNVEMTQEYTLVHFGGQNVTAEINGEEIGAIASQISQIPEVRNALLMRQRKCFVNEAGLIAEGRDCGTVVFPDAPVKIYLTAGAAQRAQRRAEEESSDLGKTLEMQKKRDQQDSQRKQAPMVIPEGATLVDSSNLSLEEVVDKIYHLAKAQIPCK